MKYILQGRSINFTTDIVALAINLLDRKNIKNHCNIRVLVSNKHSSSQSFILVLVSYIRDVIITDFVLNSICAFDLIKFQNKIGNYDLSKEENSRLDNLRKRMLLMSIIIIEHKDLFVGGLIPKEEPNLAMFRYNKQDDNLLKKMQTPESVC